MAVYSLVMEEVEKTFPPRMECPKCKEDTLIRDHDQFSLLKSIIRDKCRTDVNTTGERFLFYYHPSIRYTCSCGYSTEANRHGLVYN